MTKSNADGFLGAVILGVSVGLAACVTSSGDGGDGGDSSSGASGTGGHGTSDQGSDGSADDGGADDGGAGDDGPGDSGATGDDLFDCDYWAQDCPPGEKCNPYDAAGTGAWTGLRCVPVVPEPNRPGELCTTQESPRSGLDDCDASSVCVHVDPETLEGLCVARCVGSREDPTCEDTAAFCPSHAGFVWLCAVPCDPLIGECPEHQVCVDAWEDGFVCYLDKWPADHGYGVQCQDSQECATGLFCGEAARVPDCAGTTGCCTDFCDITAFDPDAQCAGRAGGAACVPWYEDGVAPPGLDHLGGCMTPG